MQHSSGRLHIPMQNTCHKELPNVFGIADGILIIGFDTNGKEHNRMLRQVMCICH